MSAAQGKDTIYIDVDEEITGIVGKIQSSPKQIVALVLPKRANSMQSIVNMKLLKRTADQNEKQVVLITSEPRLLPLAGVAKLHVAPNLTSKPYVPEEPGDSTPDSPGIIDEGEIDPSTPVSKLAPDAKFADDPDSIEIDNTSKLDTAASKKPIAKSGKFKIPNFNTFRKKIIFAVLAILLLIFGLIYAMIIAPKANVVVKAETSNRPLSLPFIADTTATELDKDKKVVQALRKEANKSDSEKVAASGEENKGDKATGSVNMSVKKCDNPFDAPAPVPAGSGLSTNGLTFITQDTANFALTGGSGSCANYSSASPAKITAQKAGKQYNVAASTSFSVAGRPDVKASGKADGGSDEIVKVVSQTDIDKAKERLNSKQNTIQDELKTEFTREGYVAIAESFTASDADYVPSTAVGAEASDVTVNVNIKYTMIGIKQDDIKQLIKEAINSQADNGAQIVLSDGLDKAVFTPGSEKVGENQSSFILNANVITGPDINQDELKQQITGKKSGQAEELLKQRGGLTDPKVELSPFWVSKIPKASKITIEIQQADGSNIPNE